jgi:hypothetical protein
MLTFGAASAQTVIERLVSPGPLATRHANLESRCEACHAAFNRDAQNQLCVACHRPVGADVTARTGFHGHDRNASTAACSSCHTDHQGRGTVLVRFTPARFDHRATDYPLHGAHERVVCASCHLPGQKYRQASSACVDCHRTDEPHRGRLGVRCSSCHTDENWRQIRFDHSETQFPLVGAHLNTRCVSCHARERYDGTSTACVECHRDDDAHRGNLGANCGECHSAVGWGVQRFDHSRTQFPLRGRHARTECATCHVQPAGQVRLPTDCLSCHRDEDARAHQGRNGATCQECHSESDWRTTTFNHARETRFALQGGHARLTCQQCHTQPAREVRLEMTCVSCHRDDDAHAGQQGAQCEQCHSDVSWTASVRFDHGLTSFPLIGEHVGVECTSCHQSRRYQDAAIECASCHTDDDKHERRLGQDCATCHSPTGWANWRFDHDAQTDFDLTGAHIGLQCEACHTRPARSRVRQASSCIACHRSDDIHRGEFGPECSRCHTTESFSGVRPRL